MYQRPPPPGHSRNLTGRATAPPQKSAPLLKKLLSSGNSSTSKNAPSHSKELSKKLAKSAAQEKKHLNSAS